MIYETKQIPLKNGKMATFRSPVPEDAEQMLAYLRAVAGETPFLLREPEEVTMTPEQEVAFLNGIRQSECDTMIVCEVEGNLAGNCQLSRMNRRRTMHRAMVAIALRKPYWNLGIGTAMFGEMLRLAKEQGIEQLELEVVEGNTRAMALYEKMGFRVVGAKPNAIRLKDGTMRKDFYMVKELV